MCAYEFTGMTIALIVYTVFPNGLNLRLTDIGRNNILVTIVQFLYASDTPTNVCPSIHVFATISAHLCLVKSKWWFGKVKFPAPNVKDPRKHEVLYFLNKKK